MADVLRRAGKTSPPSRGAWIEIAQSSGTLVVELAQSPPSRGAWIEITVTSGGTSTFFVAPLAGGVD